MALSVLVIAAVVGGPSLDALLCGGEDGLAASAAPHPASSATVKAAMLGSIDEGLAPCVHGDCHHVAPSMPTPPSMASVPVGRRGDGPRLERRRVPVDDLQFELMRPPRG